MIKYHSKFGQFTEGGTFEGVHFEVLETPEQTIQDNKDMVKLTLVPRVRIKWNLFHPLSKEELSRFITELMVIRNKMED